MIIDLGDKSKVVTFKTNGITNCIELCKMILKKYGLTNFGSSSNVFKLMHEIDGELKHYGDDVKNNYKKAIECIDRHLENKRPIIVGVNHTINKGINEGTTDHFVVIYGKGIDEITNKPFYTYYEVGKSDISASYDNEKNRLIYDEDNSLFYDLESNRGDKKRFDVVQVRPNDGTIV